MRLLVTGGCGFVGRNFIRYVLEHYAPEMVTNVDALTTGRLANAAGFAATYGERYEFLHANAADAARIDALMGEHQYFAVVHLAAAACDPSVTASLLHLAQRHGIRRFLLASPDCPDEATLETERLARAAFEEHRQEMVITHAPENYGPFQTPAGFIPDSIIRALCDQPVPVPGDGLQTRTWLHVEDHCAALFTALLEGRAGSNYRIAGGREARDIDVAHRILDQLGKGRDQLAFVPPVESRWLARDGVSEELPAGLPRHPFERGLRETIDWYVHNREWWEPSLDH